MHGVERIISETSITADWSNPQSALGFSKQKKTEDNTHMLGSSGSRTRSMHYTFITEPIQPNQ